jgi:tetratricopeptide (TPR) repeat protein
MHKILFAILFAGASTASFAQSGATTGTGTTQEYMGIAHRYDAQKMYDSSIRYYQLVLKKEPKNVEAITAAATAYYRNKNYMEAERGYLRAIELKPGDAALHNSLGTLYITAEKYSAAVPHFEKAVKMEPRSVAAYGNLARAYFYSEKYEPAIEAVNKAMAISPREANAYYSFIPLSYQKMGNMAEARRHEKIAQQYSPSFRLD